MSGGRETLRGQEIAGNLGAARAAKVFKPWIVVRPNGGCQVLFPLTELDRLIEEVLKCQRGAQEAGLDLERGRRRG